ncbi:hypothetical protein BDV98DRAFT_598023 [Pterulicium gracile]|uniref:DUF6534 domain-containing protein n=1 Tax=Pterulicium gracile TaxID=1884261 RepID=A0A5C3Q4F5_9AGAR|nr:hypothetical protein BDV98DRAFT_598023 [Pterula gracilis]
MSVPPYNESETLQRIDNQTYYNLNLGPFLAGLAFQMFMMVVLTLQCWTYFQTMAATDSRWTRWLVGIIFFTGSFQAGTDFHILYDSFVTGFGRILYWNEFHGYQWTFTYEFFWTALIALIAHIFFLHRCFIVTRSYLLLVAGGMGAAFSFAGGIATTVYIFRAGYYTDRVGTVHTLASRDVYHGRVNIRCSDPQAAEDAHYLTIIGSFSLCSGYDNTDKRTSSPLRNDLMCLAFETAALTSVVAILNLITYAGFGTKNSIHLFFQFTIGKMYSHSVMVTLLARAKLRTHAEADESATTYSTPRITFAGYHSDSNADLVASVPRRRPHSFSTRPAGVRQTVTCSNVHDYYKEKSSELLPPGSLSTPASMTGSGKRHGNGQRGRTLLRAHSSGRITRALAARRLVGDVGWEDEGGEKRV